MDETKNQKKYESVRKAVQKIKEEEKDKPSNFSQLPIDDEQLYESTDSTYDSLFLTKSVVGKAEELASTEMLKAKLEERDNVPANMRLSQMDVAKIAHSITSYQKKRIQKRILKR